MAKLELTDSLKEKYKRHPRILEIRIILLFGTVSFVISFHLLNIIKNLYYIFRMSLIYIHLFALLYELYKIPLMFSLRLMQN